MTGNCRYSCLPLTSLLPKSVARWMRCCMPSREFINALTQTTHSSSSSAAASFVTRRLLIVSTAVSSTCHRHTHTHRACYTCTYMQDVNYMYMYVMLDSLSRMIKSTSTMQ